MENFISCKVGFDILFWLKLSLAMSGKAGEKYLLNFIVEMHSIVSLFPYNYIDICPRINPFRFHDAVSENR